MKTKASLKFKNQGFGLIQVLVSLAIVGIVTAGILESGNLIMRVRSDSDLRMFLDNKRSEILTEIKNSSNRTFTVKDPSLFEQTCAPQDPPVGPPEGCGTQFSGLVHFKDLYGKTVVNSLDPKFGFHPSTGVCNGFNSNDGNDACPIRIEVHWKANCKPTDSNGSCPVPDVFYSVKFQLKYKSSRLAMNISRYDFDQNLLQGTGSNATINQIPETKELCEALGGVWVDAADPRPDFCVLSGEESIIWY